MDKMNTCFCKYAALLCDGQYIKSGYLAMKKDDGVIINARGAKLNALKEEDIVFVNDKNIESFEGNFRAAAVILYCAVRQDKDISAAAIVDSDSILEFSSKRRPLKPILDDLAQACGVTLKCASKNVAAEIVTSMSKLKRACFMPDAGAVITGRTLDEVYVCAQVLDKACNAELLAEGKGGTQDMGVISAIVEHLYYRYFYSKKYTKKHTLCETDADKPAESEAPKAAEQAVEDEAPTAEEKPSAEVQNAENNAESKSDSIEAKEAAVTETSEADGKEASEAADTAAVAEASDDTASRLKAACDEAVARGFAQGMWSSIAIKTDDGHMLVTPSGEDFASLGADGFVKVDMQSLKGEGSLKPSRERALHAALLKKEGMGVSVRLHPYYACALSAMATSLEVPEGMRDMLGEEVKCVAAAYPGTRKFLKNVVEGMGDSDVILIAHHGVALRAATVEQAFELCAKLEEACKEFLTAK